MLHVLRVLPGPSVVKQRFDLRRHARRRPLCVAVASRSVDGGMQNAPPGSWRRWGVSNRSDPMIEGDALRRVPAEPGPCTSVSCVERSETETARSAARHFGRSLLSIDRLPHSHAARVAGHVGRRGHARPERADGRAPARGEPVLAGVPWACNRESGEGGHWIRQYGRFVIRVAAECPETRNRAADDRPTRGSVGVGPTHRPRGVVHRLVNIGTRLPGRAV